MTLVRWFSISFVALLLLCSGAVLIGRLQPEVDVIPELQPCSIGLCWANIVPGKTNLEDSRNLLNANSEFTISSDPLEEYAFYATTHLYRTHVIAEDRKVVNDIWLYFRGTRILTAGQIVRKFGNPCAISPNSHIVLIYPGFMVHFDSHGHMDNSGNIWVENFNPSWLAKEMELGDSRDRCSWATNTPGDSFRVWQGFKSY